MRFDPPPGYQPVYQPAIPYTGPIYGGLKTGMSVYIEGTTPDWSDRITVNFLNALVGYNERPLHFDIRFAWGNVVVMNTAAKTGWQSEEKINEMPLRKGEDFQLLFTVTSEAYKIKLNGSDLYEYKHRIPPEQVLGLNIDGDVIVHLINIIGGGSGYIQGYPGLGQMQSVPYVGAIYGGLKVGMTVCIAGAIPCDVTRFQVSLQAAEAKCSDKALFVNPRFRPKEAIVFNSFKNGKFEELERVDDTPLHRGELFEIIIAVTTLGYQVKINGSDVHMFKHRMPVEQVLAIAISGDVFVQCVNVLGEGAVPALPGPGYVGVNAYSLPIPGGLKEGMRLYVRGSIPPIDTDRFLINLEGGGDKALHFNPRFKQKVVALNTQKDNGWLKQVSVEEFPFRKGETFELVCLVTSESYQLSIDGRHFYEYEHRIPPEQVTDIVIKNEVVVETISINSGEDIILEGAGDVTGAPGMLEIPGPGDVRDNRFTRDIDGGLKEGMSLYFEGTLHSEINRFDINLQGGGHIALHFKVPSNLEFMVFNTYCAGAWGIEEHCSDMPFAKGKDFQLAINITGEGYEAIVNGSKLYTYKHREPLESVTTLEIGGDVSIRTIKIFQAQDSIREYAGPGDTKGEEITQALDGGLEPGTCLYLQGKVNSGCNWFSVNLDSGSDIVLHMKPYLNANIIVFNNCLKNVGWQQEEKLYQTYFKQGENFDLLFNVTLKGFEVFVNGSMIHLFKHRQELDLVTQLRFEGDITANRIDIIRERMGGEGGELGYNWRFLPMMGTQPVYSPPVPYKTMIPGGMTLKKTIVFGGKIPPESKGFACNFYVNGTKDRALHINPRIKAKSVVRNSLLRGKWGKEEHAVKFNPFQEGKNFEMMIRCWREEFAVFVNGAHMFNYVHRHQPFTDIDVMEILGDVQLSYVFV